MKIIKNTLKSNYIKIFLLYIWQLPLNIVGIFYLVYLKIVNKFLVKQKHNVTEIIKNTPGCVSLGNYIFISKITYDNTERHKNVFKHEYGHHIQSMILGPLYLLIIGIPSLIHALFYTRNSRHDYYDFWTERWANKLSKDYVFN